MSQSSIYKSSKAGGRKQQYKALVTLLPYLWPAGEWSMRTRVLIALVFMVLSKVVNVYVPLLYKDAVDVLSGEINPVIALPVARFRCLRRTA